MSDQTKGVMGDLLKQILVAIVTTFLAGQIMIARLDERVISIKESILQQYADSKIAHSEMDRRINKNELDTVDLKAKMEMVCVKSRP